MIIWKSYFFNKENNLFFKSECSFIKWKSIELIPTRRFISHTKKKGHHKNNEWQEIDSFFNIFNACNNTKDDEFIQKEEIEYDFFLNDYIPQCMEYYLKLIP